MKEHPATPRVLHGPRPCDKCGQEVIYIRQERREGWLHESGDLVCGRGQAWRRIRPPEMSAREYNRLRMREKRARERAA